MDATRKGRRYRGRHGRIALAMGLLAALAAGAVMAQPAPQQKPKVYVFPFVRGEDVSEVVFNKVEQYFLTLFKMSTKLEVLTDEELRNAEVAKVKEEKRKAAVVAAPWLEKADNLLWKGKDLFEKKSYDKALQALSDAKELYEQNYLQLRDYDKLVDANLQLAIAFFLAGYKDNGEELLKDVLVWRPNLVVDRKKYPKEFVDSLESLKGLLENRKGGLLRVEAVPPEGAKVFVDGLLKGTLEAGKTGLDIDGLYRGRHYVQVVREGYDIWAQKVGIPEAGRTQKVVAELKTAPVEKVVPAGEWEGLAFRTYQFALTGDYGMEFSKQAKALADQAQVPYLLFGFVSAEPKGTRLTLFLFKAEWSALAEVEPVSFDQNLTNLQVNLLFLEANLASALDKFPKNKVVRGTPEVYIRSKEMAAAKAEPPPPVVAKPEPPPEVKPEPKPEPVPVPVVAVAPKEEKARPVEVVKPEPKPSPVRITPAEVEKPPELTSRTQPQEDLGDLSAIFASGGGSGSGSGSGTVVGPAIPTGPGIVEDDWGKKRDTSGGITTKWWFWTGVAVGAGLLGGGGYLLYDQVAAGSGGSGYSANVYWQPY